MGNPDISSRHISSMIVQECLAATVARRSARSPRASAPRSTVRRASGKQQKRRHDMQDIQHYSAWRASVAEALEQYRGWVQAAELLDGAAEQRLARALARVRDDRLSVAFVAEF